MSKDIKDSGAPADTSHKKRFSWASHAVTHAGKVRNLNEDACLDSANKGFWLVADGMGGHSAGDVASKMIVKGLFDLPQGLPSEEMLDVIEDSLVRVNNELLAYSNQQKDASTVGSTVAALLLSEGFCFYMWAGDSRVYRARKGRMVQMTRDHSQVEQYVEQGLITANEALSHPHGNMITRAVGVADFFYLDMDMQAAKQGDRYMLCSDGLTKHIGDLELQDFLNAHSGAEECCQFLVDETLRRGASDNVTVIVVDVMDGCG
ncbi:MAG: PP2C family protein-serine/threonine phosphatase [Candidatus Eutrophobiaceae bacterium]